MPYFKVGFHVIRISDTASTMTQCHIPEALNFQQHHCENIKIKIFHNVLITATLKFGIFNIGMDE
jgi:hypothetical protein